QSLSIQVGANDGETISIDLQQINRSTLGLDDLDVTKLAKTVTAGGMADATDATIKAAADATFDITDGGAAPVDTDGAILLQGNDDAYYLKTSDGKFYAATVSAITADAATVEVDIDSDTEV